MAGVEKQFIDVVVPIDFTYNQRVGTYTEKYIKGLQEKKILAVKCPECNRVVAPPRTICGKCNARMEEWLEVGPAGVVENYTVGHVRLDRGAILDCDPPWMIGLIQLDGADTLIAGEIKGIDPSRLEKGLRVRAVWKEELENSLHDLAYFEPEGS